VKEVRMHSGCGQPPQIKVFQHNLQMSPSGELVLPLAQTTHSSKLKMPNFMSLGSMEPQL
jgi:hypothetical protein